MAGYDDFSGLLGLMQGQGLGQAEAYPEPVQTAAPRVSMGNILKDNWGLCWFLNNLPFNKCSIFDPLGKYTTPSETHRPK